MTGLYARLRDRYWRWQAWRHWWGLDGWLELIRDSATGLEDGNG